MNRNRTIDFFDTQFARQIGAGDYALNPFEQAALPYVRGTVLDLGCGLGNLGIAAARRGASVLAVDASPNAISRIRSVAHAEGIDIRAEQADIAHYAIAGEYDAVIAIGLVMFFERSTALELLQRVQRAVTPGGLAIVNTLVAGTTYMEMFQPGSYCLFDRDELAHRFKGWNMVRSTHEGFDAPGGTRKEFATVIAQKPGTR